MTKLIVFLLCAAVAFVLLRLFIGQASNGNANTGLQKDDKGFATLETCENSMRCVSSTANSERNKVEPFTFDSSAEGLIDKLVAEIDGMPGTVVVEKNASYLHASFRTRILGFTDDVEFLLDQDQNILHVRSASRLGKSDLGANRARIEKLRINLSSRL